MEQAQRKFYKASSEENISVPQEHLQIVYSSSWPCGCSLYNDSSLCLSSCHMYHFHLVRQYENSGKEKIHVHLDEKYLKFSFQATYRGCQQSYISAMTKENV